MLAAKMFDHLQFPVQSNYCNAIFYFSICRDLGSGFKAQCFNYTDYPICRMLFCKKKLIDKKNGANLKTKCMKIKKKKKTNRLEDFKI